MGPRLHSRNRTNDIRDGQNHTSWIQLPFPYDSWNIGQTQKELEEVRRTTFTFQSSRLSRKLGLCAANCRDFVGDGEALQDCQVVIPAQTALIRNVAFAC